MNTPEESPRLRLLFEDAPIAYHEIDPEGRISRVNRAECAMLGYDRSELTGMPVWELVVEEDRGEIRDLIMRKLAGVEQLTPFQARLVRRSGSQLTVGFYENLMEDHRGAIVGIRGILVNITEREQTM